MKIIFVLSLYVFVAEAKVRIIGKAQQVQRIKKGNHSVLMNLTVKMETLVPRSLLNKI